MGNILRSLAQFRAEHDRVMLELSITGPNIDLHDEVDYFKALFEFCEEVNATVLLGRDRATRRGVSIYEEYWHAACAFIPDDVARSDLIHALLFIFISAHGGRLKLTKKWSSRRTSLFNRVVSEETHISELVNTLRCTEWFNVNDIEALIFRADVFRK